MAMLLSFVIWRSAEPRNERMSAHLPLLQQRPAAPHSRIPHPQLGQRRLYAVDHLLGTRALPQYVP